MKFDLIYPTLFIMLATFSGFLAGLFVADESKPKTYHECVYEPLRELAMGDRQVDTLLAVCREAFGAPTHPTKEGNNTF